MSETIERINQATSKALVKLLLKQGYLQARVLPDGSVAALLQLVFTRAIVLGCTSNGWSSRFCFADQDLADRRFCELENEDDEPEGFIARR